MIKCKEDGIKRKRVFTKKKEDFVLFLDFWMLIMMMKNEAVNLFATTLIYIIDTGHFFNLDISFSDYR